MSQVTLKVIYDRFDRFEDKLDKRFERLEKRTAILEGFASNLKGKITLFVFLINAVIFYTLEAIKNKLNIKL